MAPRARQEDEDGDDELDEVVERGAHDVRPLRHLVQEPAHGARVRLRLVVVDEAREVSPARVTAQLDEAGAEHDAYRKPAEEPEHDGRRRRRRERTQRPPRTEEYGDEPRLEELRLPAEAVE